MNLTTIFENHVLTKQQRVQAQQYMRLAASVPITNSAQLSICILGDRGSGKTSCALCLGQCPFLELPASKKSSVLQTVVQTQQQTQSQTVLIHDSYEFLLANTVLLLIDASRPESALYLQQFVKQIHSSQLVFVLVNKCDVASREQFRQAMQAGLEHTQTIQKTNNCQLCTTIMKDNFSLQQLTEIIGLSIANQKFQNARAEMLRAQKEFARFFQANANNFRDRINGSLEKRGFERMVQTVFVDAELKDAPAEKEKEKEKENGKEAKQVEPVKSDEPLRSAGPTDDSALRDPKDLTIPAGLAVANDSKATKEEEIPEHVKAPAQLEVAEQTKAVEKEAAVPVKEVATEEIVAEAEPAKKEEDVHEPSGDAKGQEAVEDEKRSESGNEAAKEPLGEHGEEHGEEKEPSVVEISDLVREEANL